MTLQHPTHRLWGGLALSALAHAALAQQAPAAPPAAAIAADATAPITEIIVSATKRLQRLQDVPVAVAVVDGAQLARQNISEVGDLVRAAASLNAAGPFGALSIRGVGSVSFSRSSEGSVGVVVDGVALGGSAGAPPQLFDVARVEVLEGPQGTLFGRNASAGLINIVTVAPDPTRFTALGQADLGSRGNQVARAALNVPLADNAALRVSGSVGHQPEQLHNLPDDSWSHPRLASARARLLWKASPDVTLNVIADRSDNHIDGGGTWSVYRVTPGSKLASALAACGVAVIPENNSTCVDPSTQTSTSTYGLSAQADVRLGDYTLSAIAAHRGLKSRTPQSDSDSTPFNLLRQPQSQDSHNNSQELRLASPAWEGGEYVLGLYSFDARLDASTTQIGPALTFVGIPPAVPAPFPVPLGQTSHTATATASSAVFGQGSWRVTPKLGLILGARYGREQVAAHTRSVLATGAVAPLASLAPVDGSASDTYASWRAGTQYELTRDVMAYAGFTRGYKGPAVNDQDGGHAAAPLIVKPEVPNAAEVGVKTTLFEGRVAANVALFHNRIDNFQAQFFDQASKSFVYSNAPSMTSRGASASLMGRQRNVTWSGGVAYTNATYGAGYLVPCAGPTVPACIVDAGGNQLAGAPKWKLTLGGEYTAPVLGHLGFVQSDVVYQSRTVFNAANDPLLRNGAAAIVGGRIGMRGADGKWSVALYTRNLFDTFRAATRFATPTAIQQLDPQSYSQIAGPDSRRVLGVSLEMRY